MHRSPIISVRVSLLALGLALLGSGCGGGEAKPPESPAPEPPAAPAPPPPTAAEPVAEAKPPAPEPPPAPPPEHKAHRHHSVAAMLIASANSLELKPEQKTAIEGIEKDLEKLGDEHKDIGKKLANDVADGVEAGKIDHKKTDADIKEIAKSIEATTPSIQDAVNRLHKTLDPAQRKQLVDNMNAKVAEMREHGMHGEGMHGMGGPGMHEHGPEGAGKPGPGGPGKGPGKPPMGKPPMGGEKPGMGGPPMGEHGMGEHGMGEHGMGEHGMGEGPMHRVVEELGLSPEQKDKLHKKFEAEMKARGAAMKQQMAAMQKHIEAIGKAFVTDTFDAKKAGVGKPAPDMAKRMAEMRVSFAEIVLSVLTPEQRPKFAAHLREHAGDPDPS